MIVNGTLSVECKKCGHAHDFSADDSDFNITDRDEREQGQERTYTWENNFECEGDDCDNQIEFECGVWEYPPTQLSHESVDIDGAAVTETFSYDLSEQPDPDDIE